MNESLKEKYTSLIYLIERLEFSLKELEKFKVKKVSANGPPKLYLLTWKLKSYFQTCLYRIIELTEQSLVSWDSSLPSVTYLLVRSVLETSAYLYDLAQRFENIIKSSQDINHLTEFIDKWKFGEKNSEELPVITNIKTIIQRVSKQYPEVDDMYNKLSSFCHPNYSAVGMLYSYQNMDEMCFYIDSKYGLREDLFNALLSILIKSLELTKQANNKLEPLYPIINELNKKAQDSHKY